MGSRRFFIAIAAMGAVAFVGGWFLGKADTAEDRDPREQVTDAKRLTALTEGESFTAASGFWERLDAAKSPDDFPQLLAGMDFSSLASFLTARQEPRWTRERWGALQDAAIRRMSELDTEATLEFGRKHGGQAGRAFEAAFFQLVRSLDAAEFSHRLGEIDNPKLYQAAVLGAVEGLVSTDPQRALALASESKMSKLQRRDVLTRLYSKWAKVDPAAAAEAALEEGDLSQRELVIQAIAGSWAKDDPHAAMTWAGGISDRTLRANAQALTLHEMANRNPQEAIARFLELEASDMVRLAGITVGHYEALMPIYQSFADDTEAAMQFLLAVPPAMRNQVLSQRAGLFFGDDPEAALALAGQLPVGSNAYSGLLRSAIPSIAEEDHARALELAHQLPFTNRVSSITPAIAAWIGKDSEGAFEYMSENPDDVWGAQPLLLLRSLWQEGAEVAHIEQVLELIDGLPESVSGRDQFRSQALESLFNQSPERVMEFAQDNPETVAEVTALWAQRDPEGFEAWQREHGPASRRVELEAGILSQAQSDPQAAAEMLTELSAIGGDDDMNGRTAESAGQVVEFLAEQNFADAGEWVAGLAEGAIADRAAGELALRWAAVDAESASAWIGQMREGRARDYATLSLVREVVTYDVDTAVEWIRSIGHEGVREHALSSSLRTIRSENPATALELVQELGSEPSHGYDIMEEWAASDLDAARQAVESLDQGAFRDGAMVGLVEHLAAVDFDSARELADTMSDESMREEAIAFLGMHLVASDPAATVELLGEIENRDLREEYLAELIQEAAEEDPNIARQMIEALPAGDLRDRLTSEE